MKLPEEVITELKNVLYQKYYNDNYTVVDIAKLFGCDRRTIYRYLSLLDIPRKGRSMALKGKVSNFKGKKFTPESLKKKKDSAMAAWRNDEIRSKMLAIFNTDKYKENKRCSTIRVLSEGRMSQKETSIEQKMELALLSREIYTYVKQYKYDLGVADFWIPEGNIIIHCDGEYWHSKPKVANRDKRQDKWLSDNGYIVYRFSDREINNSAVMCVNTIQELQ